ncbi:MAG: CBS domain-containing protein [Deltaproteobacteria bacterium]|nr:CBS domain-containing protein [Deltaproteobacteria bacterium]
MRCEEIMKKEVTFVSAQDSVERAAQKMRDENVGFLPVCDQNQKVLGTLTDRDIVIRQVAAGLPLGTKVGEVMTREAVTCQPSDDIKLAEKLLSEHKKSRIMCTDEDGKLVGVISLSDIAQAETEDRSVAETVRKVTEREAASPI